MKLTKNYLRKLVVETLKEARMHNQEWGENSERDHDEPSGYTPETPDERRERIARANASLAGRDYDYKPSDPYGKSSSSSWDELEEAGAGGGGGEVYAVLVGINYEGEQIAGVFSDKGSAVSHAKELASASDEDSVGTPSHDYVEVQAFRLNEKSDPYDFGGKRKVFSTENR